MNDRNNTMTRANSVSVRKMVLTAMLAGLGFVLSTFVYFPSMAPFQHFCNIIGAVFLGPWYGFAAALLTGLLRMLTGRTIQAVVGAVIGAFLSGLLYRRPSGSGAPMWARWSAPASSALWRPIP